jgi:hypothetical protein
MSDGAPRGSSRPLVKPPKGLRKLERWFVGVAMGITAFVLERIVLRSVKKQEPEVLAPTASTLTSKGGDVDLDDLHLGKGLGRGA